MGRFSIFGLRFVAVWFRVVIISNKQMANVSKRETKLLTREKSKRKCTAPPPEKYSDKKKIDVKINSTMRIVLSGSVGLNKV